MFNIDKFLKKISKDVSDNELYKKNILEIIKNQSGLDIDINCLEIKDYILFIRSTPPIKNKIFIFKKNILENISNKLDIKIIDIR